MTKNDFARLYQLAEKIAALDGDQWDQVLNELKKSKEDRIIKALTDDPEKLDLISARSLKKPYIS